MLPIPVRYRYPYRSLSHSVAVTSTVSVAVAMTPEGETLVETHPTCHRARPCQKKTPPRFNCIYIGAFARAGGVLPMLLSLGSGARTACRREPGLVHQRGHERREHQSTGAIRTAPSTTARDEEIRTLPHLQARDVFVSPPWLSRLGVGEQCPVEFYFVR